MTYLGFTPLARMSTCLFKNMVSALLIIGCTLTRKVTGSFVSTLAGTVIKVHLLNGGQADDHLHKNRLQYFEVSTLNELGL